MISIFAGRLHNGKLRAGVVLPETGVVYETLPATYYVSATDYRKYGYRYATVVDASGRSHVVIVERTSPRVVYVQ